MEYGSSTATVVGNLAKAHGIFGTYPFRREELELRMEMGPKEHSKILVMEGRLTETLVRGLNNSYTFSESSAAELSSVDGMHGLSWQNYRLLEGAGAPWDVWDNAARLFDGNVGYLARMFQEFGDRPFDNESAARVTGLTINMVNKHIRQGFFAGLLRKEGNLYRFRNEKVSDGWELLYEYGFRANRHIEYLERAFGRFERRPFSFENFLDVSSPLPERDARRIIGEARLAGIVEVDGEGNDFFVRPPPDEEAKAALRKRFPDISVLHVRKADKRELPPEILSVLEKTGIDREVWDRAGYLGDIALARLTRALEAYGGESPFKDVDYTALTGIPNENRYLLSTRRELRRASLAGLLTRVGDGRTYAFRTTKGAGGWGAFYEYGSEAQNVVRLLRSLLRAFGEEPMTLETARGRLRSPLPGRLLRRTFREGSIVEVLRRGPRFGEYTFIDLSPPGSSRKFRKPKPSPKAAGDGRLKGGHSPSRASRQGEDDYLTGIPGIRTSKDVWEESRARVYTLLEKHGVSPDIWAGAPSLPVTSIRGIVSALERFGFGPFGIADYQDLVGCTLEEARDAVMSAVLSGILRRGIEEDAFVFGKIKGSSGWSVFYEWEDDALYFRLRDALDYFGARSFRAEDYRLFRRSILGEGSYGGRPPEDDLVKGLMAEVLEREGGLYKFIP